MNSLWQVTFDEYFEVVEICKKAGVKPGESMEPFFLAYMEAKGRKPVGATELNHEEIIAQALLKNPVILDITHDKTGKQIGRIIKAKMDIPGLDNGQ